MYVNLLPSGFRRQLLVRQCLSLWIPVWLAASALGVLYLGVAFQTHRAAQASLAQREALCEPIRLVAAESQRLATELQVAQARKANLSLLSPPNRALPVVKIVSSAVQPLAGRLQLLRLSFHHSVEVSQKAGQPARSENTESGLEKGQLTLEAVAVNDAVMASFIESLRRVKVMRQVELKSSTEWHSGGQDCRKFDVICHFGRN